MMTSFEFLIVRGVYRDTVNLFRAYTMAICKENQLNIIVSIYRYKRKPPYDTLFGGSRKFGVNRCKIEGGLSI